MEFIFLLVLLLLAISFIILLEWDLRLFQARLAEIELKEFTKWCKGREHKIRMRTCGNVYLYLIDKL